MRILFLLLICFAAHTISQAQVKVRLHSIVGYNGHEEFARRAAAAFETVVNSPEFRDRVLAGTYLKTNGLTNEQLYDRIMAAHEVQGPGGADSVIDLRARTLRVDADESDWKDNCNRSTIGVDGSGTGVTAICPNKLKRWVEKDKVGELAGHYAHEYMHILGFDHINRRRGQRWRERTFVYKIGNLVAELVEKSTTLQAP